MKYLALLLMLAAVPADAATLCVYTTTPTTHRTTFCNFIAHDKPNVCQPPLEIWTLLQWTGPQTGSVVLGPIGQGLGQSFCRTVPAGLYSVTATYRFTGYGYGCPTTKLIQTFGPNATIDTTFAQRHPPAPTHGYLPGPEEPDEGTGPCGELGPPTDPVFD